MTRVRPLSLKLLLVLLVATTAFAKPSFDDLIKKFKPATLPLNSKDLAPNKTKLTAAEVALLGVTKVSSPELEMFKAWTTKPGEGESVSVSPLVAIPRTGHTVLVVRLEHELPMSSFSGTCLLTYGPKGELLDGLRFSSSTSSEAGGVEELSALTSEGSVGRKTVSKIPMMEEGLPAELVTVSEQPAKLTAAGRFQTGSPVFTTRDGAFIDRKTREELRVFGEKVFYRANDTKPFQALLREGDAVRFKPNGKQYVLSWDEKRKNLVCTNPDGSVQTFVREW